MAKKTFKGGLDSLIENSLGIKKLKGKKTVFKGNPVDLAVEEEDENKEDEQQEENSEETQPEEEVKTEKTPQETSEPAVSLDVAESDTENVAYLKNMIHDLRHELFLWRNGKINIQTFNQTLHLHNLKYNPENNEIEEF